MLCFKQLSCKFMRLDMKIQKIPCEKGLVTESAIVA